jgi:putative transposase
MVGINQTNKISKKSEQRASRPPQRNAKGKAGGTPAATGSGYMTEGLVKYRRKMPHWRLSGSVYFVTWRLAPSQAELSPEERGLIMTALRYFDGRRYELYAGVVMNDHVHALVKPLEDYRLQKLVHSWKSFTAHELRRDSGKKLWQEEYFDRIVRDEQEFLNKARYILNNPLSRWPEMEEYPWVWVKQELIS